MGGQAKKQMEANSGLAFQQPCHTGADSIGHMVQVTFLARVQFRFFSWIPVRSDIANQHIAYLKPMLAPARRALPKELPSSPPVSAHRCSVISSIPLPQIVPQPPPHILSSFHSLTQGRCPHFQGLSSSSKPGLEFPGSAPSV